MNGLDGRPSLCAPPPSVGVDDPPLKTVLEAASSRLRDEPVTLLNLPAEIDPPITRTASLLGLFGLLSDGDKSRFLISVSGDRIKPLSSFTGDVPSDLEARYSSADTKLSCLDGGAGEGA